MADKPVPRHTKMYANSPKIESDDTGKKVVTKGPSEAEKKTARVSDGTEGIVKENPLEMYRAQAKERFDMHQKHEKEFMDLGLKYAPADSGDTGADKIDKIENKEKE